jgi:hypothetical protein
MEVYTRYGRSRRVRHDRRAVCSRGSSVDAEETDAEEKASVEGLGLGAEMTANASRPVAAAVAG